MVVDYLSSQLDWAGYQVSTTPARLGWISGVHHMGVRSHTEDPVPPLDIAKQQDFGRQGEKAARAAWAKEEPKRHGHPDGRPATYDTHIDSEWNPSLGIRKGWAGRS